MKVWISTLFSVGALLVPRGGDAQVMVVSNAVQEREALPGETYGGTIRLRNTSAEMQEVRVYQTGYLFHADGRSLHVAPDSQPRSNAGWMGVTPTSLVIAAGDEVDVGYTVSVPKAGVSAGTYWSMIMVEPLARDVPDGRAAGAPSVGVRTVLRFGIQIATHVSGEVAHQLGIENARVASGTTGERELTFELINTGVAAYRPNVSVEIFDAQGVAIATLQEQRGLMYPGTSTLQRFALADLPPGQYEALVVVDTGSPEVFGAQIRLIVAAAR